jgi:hypothetical protein
MQEPSSMPQPSVPAETGGGATPPRNDEATIGSGVATTVDQSKVEQFAAAYVQVQSIQQQAQQKLQTATDPARAGEVQTQAQSDMIAAVERSGLEIEEFNQIVASMAADTELRSRISAEVQKRVAPPSATPGSDTGT